MDDGILVIDKPGGVTSHDVVARVRRALGTRRVGHTGTLDPFATGVLLACVNRATRLAQFLTGEEKEYLARVRLGMATETGDLTGAPLGPAVDARGVSAGAVAEALARFRGRTLQVPPMYSAKKVGGVRLYELARRGEEIERQPITVEIRELELQALEGEPFHDGDGGCRDFDLRVVCSAGTYVRTLADDLGRALGVGAHLAALRRTRIGGCDLGRALRPEQLEELAAAGSARGALIPMAEALSLPAIELSEEEARSISHGRALDSRGWGEGGQLAKLCRAGGELVAVAGYDAEARLWRPRVVLGAEKG